MQKTSAYIGTMVYQFLRTVVVHKWKRWRKKQLQKVFKSNGLDENMKIVNYLDVTSNLNDGTYRYYQTPSNIIQYIHVESNHPPNIIKQIPKTIEKRLSQFSSDEDIFNESAPFYEDKLHQSGYQQKLKYNPVNTKTHNERNTKEIWSGLTRQKSANIFQIYLISIFLKTTTASTKCSTKTASRSAIVAPKIS